MQDLVDYAQSHQLTFDDIYLLKTREQREKEIAKKAIEESRKQLQKMGSTPRSLASAGIQSEPLDEDRAIFNAIKKAASGSNIFGEGE